MNREELIEEAAKAMHRAAWGEDIAEPADPDYMAEMRRQAEMVLAVFEKAHAPTLHDLDDVIEDLGIDLSDDAPTDDERETLARVIDPNAWEDAQPEHGAFLDSPEVQATYERYFWEGIETRRKPSLLIADRLIAVGAGFRRSEGQESPCRCAESAQGEPSDAQEARARILAKLDRIPDSDAVTLDKSDLRAALRAAWGAR